MAVAWPGSLQQLVNQDSFSYKIGSTAIRTDMDLGPAKVRRRTTRSVDPYTVTINLTVAQFSTFYNFYQVSLNGGVNTFEINDPITGVLSEFRFIDTPSFRPLGGGIFVASMEWEKMP